MRKITLKHSLPARLEKHFSEDLNDSQRKGVMAPDGYNLILAGPGSGKTRVITYRVAYLIARGVPADSILLATFTRRAAREMVHRLESLIGKDAGKVWAGTFHHVGNRLLRRPARLLGYQPNFTILDSEDQLDLIRLAMDDAGFAAKDKLAPKPAEVEHLISFALNTRQSLADVAAVQSPGLVEWLPKIEIVAAAYTRRKLAANCMDYDDLLTQWLWLLREFPEQLEHQAGTFQHILIDEMQDTNALQVEIVETIAASGVGNLTAVGDDAQSIYRFRGANYDSVVLQGQLVTRGIPYTVRSGLRFFEQAHIKDVLAYLRVVQNPRDETSWRRILLLLPGIGPAKAAAVYQQLALSADALATLAAADTMAAIPPRSKGFFAAFVNDLRQIHATDPEHHPAMAIQAVLKGGYPSTLRQKYDRADNRVSDLEQFAVLAARYDSLERLLAELLLAGDVYGMDTIAATEPKDVLVLSSVHQAKGLEWLHVFVIRLIEDSFPHRRAIDEPGGEEEERRIFYVAVSRAMNELTLTYPSTITRGGYGPLVFTTPSRFLAELDEGLFERAELEHELDLLEDDEDDKDPGRLASRPSAWRRLQEPLR